jgi:hypothetical protein
MFVCLMVFNATFNNRAYHHWCCEFESWSGQGVQHYVIKFVSDLQQVSGFLWVLWFDDYLPSMHKAVLSISGNVYKQQEMEIDKLINDV